MTLCPKCGGTKIQIRPPWLGHEILTWSDTEIRTYPCSLCQGTGVIEE